MYSDKNGLEYPIIAAVYSDIGIPAENKMVEPNYQDLRGDNVPVIYRPGVEVKVFSGSSGNIGAIPRVSKYVPVIMLDVRLDGSSGHDNEWTSFTQEIPAGDEGFVYVLSGQAYFNSKRTSVSAGQVGHLAHTSAYDGRTTLSVLAKIQLAFCYGQESH